MWWLSHIDTANVPRVRKTERNISRITLNTKRDMFKHCSFVA